MGVQLPKPDLTCSCGKACSNLEALLGHARAREHACGIEKCYTCGRLSIQKKLAAATGSGPDDAQQGDEAA